MLDIQVLLLQAARHEGCIDRDRLEGGESQSVLVIMLRVDGSRSLCGDSLLWVAGMWVSTIQQHDRDITTTTTTAATM